MRTYTFVIEKEYDGNKACDYLRRVQKFSYALIVKLRHNPNSMILDGSPIRTIDPVKSGSQLVVTIPEKESDILPNPNLNLSILFEDEDIMVIDKPPFMPVHPSKGHQDDTVANFCICHNPNSIFRVIGRLDKDTSGLIIVAKNIHSAAILTDSPIEKRYFAIAEGIPDESHMTIDAPICDSDPMSCRRYVGNEGKPAVTEYFIKASGEKIFLADVRPKTGRTHQIRVHFSYLGYPLCGDSLYGGKTDLIVRNALHRYYLSFTHPITGEKMEFESPLPTDMKKLTEQMRFV